VKVKTIVVNDMMQKGYRYTLAAPMGGDFDPEFAPDLTPKEMLRLGVFGGKYMTDCTKEFPVDWFDRAKLSPRGHDPSLNYFGVSASQPLSVWHGLPRSFSRSRRSRPRASMPWATTCS
jgi:hypothetical protein